MLVVDTNAFVSLGVGAVHDCVIEEFAVATTEMVLDELTETATYADQHDEAAAAVLELTDQFDIYTGSGDPFTNDVYILSHRSYRFYVYM